MCVCVCDVCAQYVQRVHFVFIVNVCFMIIKMELCCACMCVHICMCICVRCVVLCVYASAYVCVHPVAHTPCHPDV